jgi:hypothetical protein
MTSIPEANISKSDFLLFCEAPRHLWAKCHERITVPLSEMNRLTGEQGYQVEALAHAYLEQMVKMECPGKQLSWQATFSDGPFEARVDALLYDPLEDRYDLFEIKSSTAVDQTDLLDVTFQAAILKQHIRVGHYYLLHLNKEYLRSEALDLSELFVKEDITEQVQVLLPQVETARQLAFLAAGEADPARLEGCLAPRQCPCPETCHPDLPDFSIFDIPMLSPKKKRALLEEGILEAGQIPESFDLNDKQRLVADRARTGTVHLDKASLTAELEKLHFPLYFLDYETCLSAIPQYPGYFPQQQIVFQFSLHVMQTWESDPEHHEHLSLACGDPALSLPEALQQVIGDQGTVVVWNKTFEMTRNREMAVLHPQYAGFLEDLNQRIYDLGDPVRLGYYLHPGFKGSWSIKQVLPVMVPSLRYENLEIHQGDQASLAWWNLSFGSPQSGEKEQKMEALKRYCELDTLAMVELYRAYRSLVQT